MRAGVGIAAMMLAGALAAGSCTGGAKGAAQSAPAVAADSLRAHDFSADSAMAAIKAQLAFGPRVPGSQAHQQCAHWIMTTLAAAGADTVTVQRGPGLYNILASYRGAADPAAADSLPTYLLLAHYDTRPWADNDPDPANHTRPVPGANDGASGVAVMLEVARQMGLQRPPVNVDLLFTDLEDSGSEGDDNSWCKGAQHFAAALPYPAGRLPRAGVLLDMVGGQGAVFHREYFSEHMARGVNDDLWTLAARLGLGSRFRNETGYPVTDDHLPLNNAGIPTADIIENRNQVTNTFPPTWHTVDDDLRNVSAETLGDVGRLVTTYIYTRQ